MPVIRRISSAPYAWDIVAASLDAIANQEKKLPAGYIRADGYGITPAARRYLEPLIQGEAPPPYRRSGLPHYVALKNVAGAAQAGGLGGLTSAARGQRHAAGSRSGRPGGGRPLPGARGPGGTAQPARSS